MFPSKSPQAGTKSTAATLIDCANAVTEERAKTSSHSVPANTRARQFNLVPARVHRHGSKDIWALHPD